MQKPSKTAAQPADAAAAADDPLLLRVRRCIVDCWACFGRWGSLVGQQLLQQNWRLSIARCCNNSRAALPCRGAPGGRRTRGRACWPSWRPPTA